MTRVPNLMTPRVKVIALYPKCGFKIGDILYVAEDGTGWSYMADIGLYHNSVDNVSDYSANFQPIPWWSDREDNEMPQYIRITGFGCTVEQGGIAKVVGTGIFPDEGRCIGNEGNRYVFIEDKYKEQYGHNRMNCRNCIPATETEYNEYLKQKEANNGR